MDRIWTRITSNQNKQLQGGGESFAIITCAFDARQPVMGGPLPDDSADQNRNYLRLRRKAHKDTGGIRPVIERLQRARVNIRIGFDFPGGTSQCNASSPQMG